VNTNQYERSGGNRLSKVLTEFAIQLTAVAILLYWALAFIAPFITVVIWSAVIAVALYPPFDWLATRLGNRRRLAAALITILSLLLVIGPATWLALALAQSLGSLYGFDASVLHLPTPPDSLRSLPLIGDKIFQLWTVASTDLQLALAQIAPQLKQFGGGLLRVAGSAGTGVVQFLVSIVVAGFLLCPGPSIVNSIKMLSRRLVSSRSEHFVDLAGATIRAISRGVIGISVLQTLLAGLGFMLVGIPGAPLVTSAVLILGIVQIGPSIVVIPVIIWAWVYLETTTALAFTIYMVPVNLLDNILKPLVMARGLTTPMLVILIGVIGGTLTYGILGLFLGPIVLAVIWELFSAWTTDSRAAENNIG
jgi:predicted PurR-regulated permease PerM